MHCNSIGQRGGDIHARRFGCREEHLRVAHHTQQVGVGRQREEAINQGRLL
jgi:hypothetical protein